MITGDLLKDFVTYLLEKYAASSANSMLAALNQYLQFIGAYIFRVKRIKVQQAAFRDEEKELTEFE